MSICLISNDPISKLPNSPQHFLLDELKRGPVDCSQFFTFRGARAWQMRGQWAGGAKGVEKCLHSIQRKLYTTHMQHMIYVHATLQHVHKVKLNFGFTLNYFDKLTKSTWQCIRYVHNKPDYKLCSANVMYWGWPVMFQVAALPSSPQLPLHFS